MTFLDWSDRWPAELRLDVLRGDPPVEHVVRVTYTHPSFAGERDLLIESGTLTLDIDAVGFAQANLTTVAPSTPAELGTLDPRTGTRVHIYAGYKRPGRVEVVHEVADLALREAVARYPEHLLELRAASDDVTVAGTVLVSGAFSVAGIGEAIESIIRAALGAGTPIQSNVPATLHPELLADVLPAPVGQPLWSLIQTIADLGPVQVFCDSLGVWQLYYDPQTGSVPGGQTWTIDLDSGDVISLEAATSLEQGYANVALIRRRTDDGETSVHYASAGAPVHWGTVGMSAIVESEDVLDNLHASADPAGVLLRRCLRRGSLVNVESYTAWWVNAWWPIRVGLPGTAPALYDTQRVTFDLTAGTMTVRATAADFNPPITT